LKIAKFRFVYPYFTCELKIINGIHITQMQSLAELNNETSAKFNKIMTSLIYWE